MASSERTVGAVIRSAAAGRPSATAVVHEGRAVTNADLYEGARRGLAQLRSIGLTQGDRLLIMLHNNVAHLTTWLACSLGGIIEVPVNTDFRGQMLSYLINDSGAPAIVTEPDLLERVYAVAGADSRLRQVLVTGERLPAVQPPPGLDVRLLSDLLGDPSAAIGTLEEAEVTERDPIGILYTSGTTGPARGTLITHRHAMEYATACGEVLELCDQDVYYAPLPFFHIAGQWAVILASLINGAKAVIKPRFSVSDFWEDCDRHDVTASFLLGAMAQFLRGQPADPSDRSHSLERILMVPLVEGLDEFRSRFAVRVTTCYGSTETGIPLASDFAVSDTTVTGRPRPGYQLRILDENDEEVAQGEVGELCLRHDEPWVTMVEYHGKPEATVAAFRNQWLHSGDAMRCDADGVYHFVDRIGDTLRRRGENISSFEVEREVYAHAAVHECAAIGVPSAHTEEDLVVVVVLKQGHQVTAAELLSFLAKRAPRFMLPDQVVMAESLPKTATGKIQKGVLKREFTQRRSQQG